MLDIFGEERFKPLVRFGKVIPGYYISFFGMAIGKNGKELQSHPIYRNRKDGSRCISALKVRCRVPSDLYEDYTYDRDRPTITVHRMVMETWRPIDQYPPEQLKDDWDEAPDSFKQWVRDTAIIDHIDDDPTNNHVDNLRWVVPKENSHHRKKQIGF